MQTIPLTDLAHRIHEREAELTRLRKEHQSRENQLAKLTVRRDKLQARLRKIEAAIHVVDPGQQSAAPPAAAPAVAVAPTIKFRAGRNGAGVSLPQYLINIVGEAKEPMSIKQIALEV